jgi:hypothetical protein
MNADKRSRTTMKRSRAVNSVIKRFINVAKPGAQLYTRSGFGKSWHPNFLEGVSHEAPFPVGESPVCGNS